VRFLNQANKIEVNMENCEKSLLQLATLQRRVKTRLGETSKGARKEGIAKLPMSHAWHTILSTGGMLTEDVEKMSLSDE
jgi:hypothetical protein